MNQQNVLGKILCHRTYGAGEVTVQKGDRLTLRFRDGTERVFSLSVSVRAGAITAADPETQEWLEQNDQSHPAAGTRSRANRVLQHRMDGTIPGPSGRCCAPKRRSLRGKAS